MTTPTYRKIIIDFLGARLDAKSAGFIRNASDEINAGVADGRFSALVSLASRYTPRQKLSPTEAEISSAQGALVGWNPSAWSLLDTVRILFILSRPDLRAEDFPERFNAWFRYADEGEQCAYYRSLALLPEPQRFVWRAAEGCRTNMRSIFIATACGSAYPANHFDTLTWNQMVMKALFIDTPLVDIFGLDQKLSPSLALMVLDYMEERRSAGRNIPDDAWLCLGNCRDERVDRFIAAALTSANPSSRYPALLALARSGHSDFLQRLDQQNNTDSAFQRLCQGAFSGPVDQYAFHKLISAINNSQERPGL